MRRLFEQYLEDLKNEGASPRTVADYEWALKYLQNFCAKRNLNPLRLTTRDLREFRAWLFSLPHPWKPEVKGRSPASVNLILSAVRSFYDWAAWLGLASRIPETRRLRIKEPERPPRPLSPEEEERLWRWLEENASERVFLAFRLMRYAGLRVSEVCSLNWGDVLDLGGLVKLSVRRKGGKVTYPPVLDADLASWLAREAKRRPPDEPVVGLTPSHLKKTAWVASKELGFKFTTHRLRHTFATEVLNRGVPLDVVQEWLGHAKIETTRRYAATLSPRADEFARTILSAGKRSIQCGEL